MCMQYGGGCWYVCCSGYSGGGKEKVPIITITITTTTTSLTTNTTKITTITTTISWSKLTLLQQPSQSSSPPKLCHNYHQYPSIKITTIPTTKETPSSSTPTTITPATLTTDFTATITIFKRMGMVFVVFVVVGYWWCGDGPSLMVVVAVVVIIVVVLTDFVRVAFVIVVGVL